MKLKDKLLIKANNFNIKFLIENKTYQDLNYIDTTNVTNISFMFYGIKSLIS